MKIKTVTKTSTKVRLAFWSLLCLLLTGQALQANAQDAVAVGAQITSESSIVSGKAYLIYYVGNQASGYMKDTGSAYTGKDDSTPNERAVYYFTDNGNGTWKVKNFYTGNYWGTPTANANSYIGTSDAAAAGSWALNFQSNGNIAPSCNSHSWNRSGSNVHPWSVGTANVNQLQIFEVALSATALDEFTNYDISIATEAAATVVTGQWYVMSQRNRTSYVYEDASTHTLKHTQTKPSGTATNNANYLVQLVSGTNGNYYIKNGLGNYVGQITVSTNVPTTALKEEQHTVQKINSTDGHYSVQCTSSSVVLDANDFTLGDPATVVGWGTEVPTATGGNNDWAFYPVELVEAWNPTASEVYTLNNTNTNRGALVYDGTSSNVALVRSANLNASNVNHQWVLYPTGTEGQYYLYNVGAGKFAIPTDIAQSDKKAWVFSNNAVAVTLLNQGNGKFRIKMATNPANGTNAAVLGVNINLTPAVFNYNDAGSDFAFTLVEGADASTQVEAAVAKLVDSQTALSAVPASGTNSWYVIRIKTHGTFANRYVYPSATEQTYNSTNYPLTFDHDVDIRPAINDVKYFTRISNTDNKVYWQLPNGKYLYGANNKFPVSTLTEQTFSMDYSANGFRMWGAARYAVPYYLGSKYFIGETANGGNAYYDIYPIDLEAAGLTAWKVTIENGSEETQLSCTRADVSGLTAVYPGGYFFLPAGITPQATDFAMEGMTGNAAIDTENKTITVAYDPSISFLASDVNVIQGNETTGRGNTMQALLRVKVTPNSNCTPIRFNVNITGADQLDKVAVYSTTIDEIRAEAAEPQKLGEVTAAEGELEIPVTANAITAGQSIYYWITADVKSTATLQSNIDAAITAIAYSNEHGGNTCDLTSIGNPEGQMCVFKQQTFLWTPDHANQKYYRIPTMINTADGGIVALTDYRHEHPYDLGKNASNGAGAHVIDVEARRSTDGGLTWQAAQTIAAGDGTNVASWGYGDPAIVRDADGTLHCMMAAGPNSYASGMLHMGYVTSSDNGATWTEPVDLYTQTLENGNDRLDKGGLTITSAFTTGGKGVTFDNGRMAFAFLGKVGGTTNIYPLYSDDKGATWHVSPTPAFSGGDESKFEIMNDNSLMVSVRKGSYNGTANRSHNQTTGDASAEGIATWGTAADWTDMNANGCNADILYYSRSTEGEQDILLHTLTKSYSTFRKDLRLYMSVDQGTTWTEIYQLQAGYAAYSSMQKLPNGDLAIIFEDGSIGNKDKQDCYAINYIVLDKEQITSKYDMAFETRYNPFGFNQTKTYTIKNESTAKYISSNAEAETGYAMVTANAEEAAQFVLIPVAAQKNYYYMYDTVSGNYLLPDYSANGLSARWTWSVNPTSIIVRDHTYNNYATANTYTFGNYCAAAGKFNDSNNSGDYLGNFQQNSPSLAINHWFIEAADDDAVVEMNRMTANVESLVNSAALVGTQLQYTANVGQAERGTVVVPFEADVTGTVEAYTLSTVDGETSKVVGTKVETIAANQPVLLKNQGTLVLTAKEGTLAYSDAPAEGVLRGVYSPTPAPVGSYVLQKQGNEVAFFHVEGTQPTVGAFRAYLETTGNARMLTISFDDELTSIGGATQLKQKAESSKQLFDLQGRRVANPQRGLYIVNGKKVVIK